MSEKPPRRNKLPSTRDSFDIILGQKPQGDSILSEGFREPSPRQSRRPRPGRENTHPSHVSDIANSPEEAVNTPSKNDPEILTRIPAEESALQEAAIEENSERRVTGKITLPNTNAAKVAQRLESTHRADPNKYLPNAHESSQRRLVEEAYAQLNRHVRPQGKYVPRGGKPGNK